MFPVRVRSLSWDSLGAAISLLCLVHCVFTPVLLALSPTLVTLLPGSQATHRVLIFLVVLVGAIAFLSGYQKHRRRLVLLPMSAGMLLIAGGAFGEHFLRSAFPETMVTMLGSILLVVAHGLNRSFCRFCAQCEANRPEQDCGAE